MKVLFLILFNLLVFALAQTQQTDGSALCDFYNALTAGKSSLANWCEGWSGPYSPCGSGTSTWTGVKCDVVDEVRRVVSLDVREKGLAGTLPSTVGNLRKLTWLSLHSNSLSGSLPSQLGELTNLKSLQLQVNKFTGSLPSTVGNLKALTYFGLHGNSLSGSLPSQLGELANLETLQLQVNKFTGSLPSTVGNLRELTYFGLHGNSLSGSLPYQLGQLTNLQSLGLSINQFTSAVPASFCDFSKSIDLYLGANSRLTCLPSCLTTANPPFTKLSKDSTLTAVCSTPAPPSPAPPPRPPTMRPTSNSFSVPTAPPFPPPQSVPTTRPLTNFPSLARALALPTPVPTIRPPTNFPTYPTGVALTWGPIIAISLSVMSVNVPPLSVRMQAYKAEEEEGQRLAAMFAGERSLLDDVSRGANGKTSKRDEVAEFAETSSVHVPSQRKLQTPLTNLPTSGVMLFSSPYMSYWNSYSFNGLGNPANREWGDLPSQQRFYLSVRIEDSGFGGENDPPRVPMAGVKTEAVRIWLVQPNSAIGFRLLKSCIPKVRLPSTSPECAKPKMIDCVVNEDVTDAINNGQGGYLQIVFASEGFTSNTCTQLPGITAEYTLSSYNANPTPAPASNLPTAVPTQPTPAPSPEPTALVCAADLFANDLGDSCLPCPAGMTTVGATGSLSINDCLCPAGLYRSTSLPYSCLACPANTVSNIGATSDNGCVNIIANFGIAFVAVFLSVVMGAVYVYLGRYHRVAFIRRDKVVLTQLYEFKSMASSVFKAQDEIHNKLKMEKAAKKINNETIHFCNVFLFYLLCAFIVPLVIFASYVLQMASVLVDVLILFRGLRFEVPFQDFMAHALSTLGPLFEKLFAPLKDVVALLAFFKIDLSAIQVTCPGATAPANLLIDYVVLGAVVIVIGSDYQLLRSLTLPSLLHKFLDMTLSKGLRCSELRHLLLTLFGLFFAFVLDYQLVLRLLMSLVKFDFWGRMIQGMADDNACNDVEGLPKGIDQFIAVAVFVSAGFILLPLLYQVGRLVVQSLPPSESQQSSGCCGSSYREEIKRVAVELEEEAEPKRKLADRMHRQRENSYVTTTRIPCSDRIMHLPSYIAPDLWLAKLSLALVHSLKDALPDCKADARNVEIAGVISAVLYPDYDSANYHFDPEKESSKQRMESVAPFLRVDQWRAYYRSQPSVQQKLRLDDVTIKLEVEFSRWMDHRRFFQLPSYSELMQAFNSRYRYARVFTAIPQYLTMGLFDLVFTRLGHAVVYQITINFWVFVLSCLGWWGVSTRNYYGVAESMETFSLDALDAAGIKRANRRPIEIVEHWAEYTKTWTAVIGPRAILFQIIPQLTPLMTYTKIMAASPWVVTDKEVYPPSYWDVNSFYRKARRDVYDRDSYNNPRYNPKYYEAHYAHDEGDDKDDKEWIVRLEAWYNYGTSSRLAKLLSNLCTLVICFGLVASGGLSFRNYSVSAEKIQKSLLLVSLFSFGLLGFFYSLKAVITLGKMLNITDADIGVTEDLRVKIDECCDMFDDKASTFANKFHQSSQQGQDHIRYSQSPRGSSSHENRHVSVEMTNQRMSHTSHDHTQRDSIPQALDPADLYAEYSIDSYGSSHNDYHGHDNNHSASTGQSHDRAQYGHGHGHGDGHGHGHGRGHEGHHSPSDSWEQVNPLALGHQHARLSSSGPRHEQEESRPSTQSHLGEEHVFAQLRDFYAVHSPDKLEVLPGIVDKWKGQNPGRPLDEIVADLMQKYAGSEDHNDRDRPKSSSDDQLSLQVIHTGGSEHLHDEGQQHTLRLSHSRQHTANEHLQNALFRESKALSRDSARLSTGSGGSARRLILSPKQSAPSSTTEVGNAGGSRSSARRLEVSPQQSAPSSTTEVHDAGGSRSSGRRLILTRGSGLGQGQGQGQGQGRGHGHA